MNFFEKINNLKESEKNNYSINELLDYFKEDIIFTILIFVNLITSTIPIPWGLGFGTIPSGIITLILSFQLIFGFKKPYLPTFIKKKNINIKFLKNNKYGIGTFFNKLNYIIKPKFTRLFDFYLLNQLIGLILIPLAILMLIPVIFTNLLPSILILLISLCYLLKDGISIILFMVIALITIKLYWNFFNLAIKYIVNLF